MVDRVGDSLLERFRLARAPGGGETDAQCAQTLQGVVVQLARPALAFGLGRCQALALALGSDRLGGGHSGSSAGCERLQQALVVGRELWAVVQTVDCDEHAIGVVLEDEWHQQTAVRVHAKRAEAVFVEARACQRFLQALGKACAQRGAGGRVAKWHLLSEQPLWQLAAARRPPTATP